MTRPVAIPGEDMSLAHSLAGFHPPKSIVPTDLLDKLVPPEKYSVFYDGVYVERAGALVQITTAPIFICERGTVLVTGHLVFPRHGLARSLLSSREALVCRGHPPLGVLRCFCHTRVHGGFDPLPVRLRAGQCR